MRPDSYLKKQKCRFREYFVGRPFRDILYRLQGARESKYSLKRLTSSAKTTMQFCHRLSDVSSLKLTTGARLIVCSYLATRLLKAVQVYRKSGQICDQLGISFLDHLPSDLFSRSEANKTSLSPGSPLLRHCETALGVTPQRLAIANVPPKQSMISVVFM